MRVFFVHHVTWSVNSVCHFFGKRRFDTEDNHERVLARDPHLRRVVAPQPPRLPAVGRQGLERWEVDLSAMTIGGLEKVGLARNVVRISPERQAERTR